MLTDDAPARRAPRRYQLSVGVGALGLRGQQDRALLPFSGDASGEMGTAAATGSTAFGSAFVATSGARSGSA